MTTKRRTRESGRPFTRKEIKRLAEASTIYQHCEACPPTRFDADGFARALLRLAGERVVSLVMDSEGDPAMYRILRHRLPLYIRRMMGVGR